VNEVGSTGTRFVTLRRVCNERWVRESSSELGGKEAPTGRRLGNKKSEPDAYRCSEEVR
jgi:hypothetical protein